MFRAKKKDMITFDSLPMDLQRELREAIARLPADVSRIKRSYRLIPGDKHRQGKMFLMCCELFGQALEAWVEALRPPCLKQAKCDKCIVEPGCPLMVALEIVRSAGMALQAFARLDHRTKRHFVRRELERYEFLLKRLEQEVGGDAL